MTLQSGWDTFRLWPVTQNEFAGGVLPFYAVLHCFASRVGAFLTRDRSTKPKLLRGKTCLTTTKGLKHLRNKILGQTISNSNRVAIFCRMRKNEACVYESICHSGAKPYKRVSAPFKMKRATFHCNFFHTLCSTRHAISCVIF